MFAPAASWPNPRTAVPVLIGYLVLLMALPSRLIFAPLGAAGTPAGVLAVGLLFWWLASLVASPPSTQSSNPVKWFVLLFAVTLLASYVVGMSRPVATVAEVNSADRALLALGGWCGASVALIDGLVRRRDLDKVLAVVLGGGVLIALLGMLQFFFNLDLADVIRIPGLTANRQFGEVISRSAFRRVTGTTTHPIEFGVVLAAVLPIGLHFARFATGPRSRLAAQFALVTIAGAIPLSVARSGILGAAIAVAVMYFTWPTAFRRRLVALLILGGAAFSVVVPGLLGTIRGLFVNASSDPSTDGRTADYPWVFQYLTERPLLGQGVGTYIPELYRTLDNQYLLVVVESGVIGLLATVALLTGTIWAAERARRRTTTERDRDLAQSLVASMIVMAVSAATFDLFGFAMSVGLLFVLIGCVGSLYSLRSRGPGVPTRRLPYRSIGIVLITGVVLLGSSAALAVLRGPQFEASATLLLEPPSPRQSPPLNSVGRAAVAARVLRDILEDASVKDVLQRAGVPDYDVALGNGSLMSGTDRLGSGSDMHLLVRAADAPSAGGALSTLVAKAEQELLRVESDAGVPSSERISVELVSRNPPYLVKGRPTRVLGAGLILAATVMAAVAHVLRRRGLTMRSDRQTAKGTVISHASAHLPG